MYPIRWLVLRERRRKELDRRAFGIEAVRFWSSEMKRWKRMEVKRRGRTGVCPCRRSEEAVENCRLEDLSEK